MIGASRAAKDSKIIPGPDWQDSLDPAFPLDQALTFPEVANSSKGHDYILCKLQHPDSLSCGRSMGSVFYEEFWRALALYGPLNAVRFPSIEETRGITHLFYGLTVNARRLQRKRDFEKSV